jgi:hypothetical protein
MWETEIAEIVKTISVKNSTMTIMTIIPADKGTG